jgi:hypothetical protein
VKEAQDLELENGNKHEIEIAEKVDEITYEDNC